MSSGYKSPIYPFNFRAVFFPSLVVAKASDFNM